MVIRCRAVAGALVLAGALWLLPAGALHPSAACAATAGGNHVAFVVDFAGAAGAPAGVILTCVAVGGGINGAEALAARAQQLGTAAPRFAPSGLLCAIDGFPASGCGDRTSGGYKYWSYWHRSTSGWSYANGGPAAWPAGIGDVEGWRYEDPGSGTPGDSPPAASATYPDICPPTAPGTAPSSTTAPPSPVTSPPRVVTAGPARASPPTTGRVSQPAPTNPATTSTISRGPAPTTEPAGSGSDRVAAALSPTAARHSRRAQSSAVPLVIAAVLVVALGSGAAWRWRQRPSEP